MAKIKWSPAPSMCRWNKVRSLRRERKLSQPEVAVGAGVALATITKVELYGGDRVTPAVQEKLARFFDCDVDDLFPCDMIGDRTREEFLRKTFKLKKGPLGRTMEMTKD